MFSTGALRFEKYFFMMIELDLNSWSSKWKFIQNCWPKSVQGRHFTVLKCLRFLFLMLCFFSMRFRLGRLHETFWNSQPNIKWTLCVLYPGLIWWVRFYIHYNIQFHDEFVVFVPSFRRFHYKLSEKNVLSVILFFKIDRYAGGRKHSTSTESSAPSPPSSRIGIFHKTNLFIFHENNFDKAWNRRENWVPNAFLWQNCVLMKVAKLVVRMAQRIVRVLAGYRHGEGPEERRVWGKGSSVLFRLKFCFQSFLRFVNVFFAIEIVFFVQ